jgi:hypothetical protein
MIPTFITDIWTRPFPDFTLSAGVPIQILLPVSKKIVLDLTDYPQYMFYLDTERERGWNNVFQGRFMSPWNGSTSKGRRLCPTSASV